MIAPYSLDITQHWDFRWLSRSRLELRHLSFLDQITSGTCCRQEEGLGGTTFSGLGSTDIKTRLPKIFRFSSTMVPVILKSASKKIVNYPENDIDTISSKDWLSRFWTNPFPRVRWYSWNSTTPLSLKQDSWQIKSYLLSLFPILTWIHRYSSYSKLFTYVLIGGFTDWIFLRCWVAYRGPHCGLDRRHCRRSTRNVLCSGITSSASQIS